MAESEFRQRAVQQNIKPNTTAESTSTARPRSKTQSRTVTWHEVSKRHRDNAYILDFYRRDTANYLEILKSLTFLHNETCNVYTHLIGALLLPFVAMGYMRMLSNPGLLNVVQADYVMFGLFFVCAECCLVFSAVYHLMKPHSHDAEQFWFRMDLLGIVIVTVGTFVPGIYWAFICDPAYQKLHWSVIMTSASATAALVCMPKFAQWRTARVSAYVALGASAFIPILHGVDRYGLEYMLQYSGLKWYLLELGLYGGGVVLYVGRTPERFAPGRFDLWGSSHQIFHAAIVCAMYVHTVALMQAFTASRTLDLCQIQATYRAGLHLKSV